MRIIGERAGLLLVKFSISLPILYQLDELYHQSFIRGIEQKATHKWNHM